MELNQSFVGSLVNAGSTIFKIKNGASHRKTRLEQTPQLLHT